jgi:hypothetical protein
LEAVRALVGRGNELTAELLAHLAELDERRLHLALGYPSLFTYCTEAHLSALCALSPHLTRENATELLTACSHKSRRQVEELLVARFPRSDVRASIRRLPARVEPLSVDRYGLHFTADSEFLEMLNRARGLASHRLPSGDLSALLKLALEALIDKIEKQRFAVGRKPQRSTVRTGDDAQLARLKRQEGAAGVADAASRREASPPPGRGCGEPPWHAEYHRQSVDSAAEHRRQNVKSARGAKRSRHIPAGAAREVYRRDHGRCSFVATDGRRCGSRVFVEIDHALAWGLGGDSSLENLRLRCHAHNQQQARDDFGRGYIASAVAYALHRQERGSAAET